MTANIIADYKDGNCSDCGAKILSNKTEGSECDKCGHVFISDATDALMNAYNNGSSAGYQNNGLEGNPFPKSSQAYQEWIDGYTNGVELAAESRKKHYRIHHHYDIGDRSVFIETDANFNPTDAAIYLQFKAEELSGDDGIALSNLAIANALIVLYGCRSGENVSAHTSIDMYSDRESRCGDWYHEGVYGETFDKSLIKPDDQLLAVLKPHFQDQ